MKYCTSPFVGSLIGLAVAAFAPHVHADLTAARAAVQQGDYGAAETALRAATGRDRAEADLLLGQVLLNTGRYAEAQALGERLGRNRATRVEGLTLEGEARVALGQYDEAVARWTQAVDRARTGVGRRARALAGKWLVILGRREQADELTQPLVDEYNDAMQEQEDHPGTPARPNPRTAVLRDAEALTYLAMAMRALNSPQDANQAFNDAIRLDAHRVETLIEHAELYLSKEDMANAGESLRDALAANAHHPRALLLRAQARLANDLDFVHAGEDLDQALAVNPNLADAYAVRAQMVLRDENISEATRLVERALAINPRSLEALSTRGVIRFQAGDMDGMRRAFDEVFRISPVYVEGYALLAEFADWGHRYDDAIVLMREGLLRPSVSGDRRLQGWMRAQLGINLLRTGDEEHGLTELQESFRVDRYNVRVYNLLNLYEDTIATQYVSETHAPFVFRFHKDEQPVLTRYVPQLLGRAYADMTRRYHFTPQGPLRVEMFAETEHFSVRTAGLPEIGVQGVCFGRLITAISPKAAPFNWAQIVWHELAHVYAIQLSRSRVPRWFTEGLSEWESFHSHPEWAREMDRDLFVAVSSNRLPRVRDFNTAFTHARDPGSVIVAYYAASKLVEYLIDRYTFDRVISMLPLWGQDLPTPDVMQRALGVSIDQLDTDFRAHTTQRLSRFASQWSFVEGAYSDRQRITQEAAAQPQNAEAQARLAAALAVAGEREPCKIAAQNAVRLDPRNTLAHYMLARVALGERDAPRALSELAAIFANRVDGYELRTLEIQAARAARDTVRLRAALEAAVRLDPSQSEPYLLLSALHRQQNRPADELAALREVVRLDQHDRESLKTLLERLVASNGWAEIRTLAEHARNCDPESAQMHFALARAFAQSNARAEAVYEFQSAIALSPPPAEAVAIRVAYGQLLLAQNDRAGAQEQAREALRAAPNDSAARQLAQQVGLRR